MTIFGCRIGIHILNIGYIGYIRIPLYMDIYLGGADPRNSRIYPGNDAPRTRRWEACRLQPLLRVGKRRAPKHSSSWRAATPSSTLCSGGRDARAARRKPQSGLVFPTSSVCVCSLFNSASRSPSSFPFLSPPLHTLPSLSSCISSLVPLSKCLPLSGFSSPILSPN